MDSFIVYFKPYRAQATWTTKHATSQKAVIECFEWDNPTDKLLAVYPAASDPGLLIGKDQVAQSLQAAGELEHELSQRAGEKD